MSAQSGLFDSLPPKPQTLANGLRGYQQEAVDAVREELKDHRGTLVLCATGTGKTQIACELIRTSQGRCLFIAHRDELIQQAANRIDQYTGQWPDIEQASLVAESDGYRHVVASVQTLSRPKRLERFDPSEFDMIVIDECHHTCAATYRRITDYFDAKLVGLTATPDRADKEALGQILDSVAYRYDVHDAIRDGWLCEIVMRRILVGSMDFSGLHTLAGDFSPGELDKLMSMEENLHAVAKPAVECAGDRKTIVFTTSVAHAERLAEIIDRYAGKPVAMTISGGTPKDERRQKLREFHDGKWQFFVNVGIATEGYDEPGVSCVVMGRPTKSRSLYVQMLGRGTRGGENCRIGDKTDCLVLDFVGNTGKHEIVCSADVLGGEASEPEIQRANEIMEKSEEPKKIDEALAEARAQLEFERSEAEKKRREGVVGDVQYTIEDHNPYVMFDVKRDYLTAKYGLAPATEKQKAAIANWMKKHAKHVPDNLSKHEASRLLAEFAARAAKKLASIGQVSFMAKKGIDARSWSFSQASRVIDWVAKNNWKKPPAHVIGAIVGGREVGE